MVIPLNSPDSALSGSRLCSNLFTNTNATTIIPNHTIHEKQQEEKDTLQNGLVKIRTYIMLSYERARWAVKSAGEIQHIKGGR